jgi:hypothetical protein
MGTTTKVPFRDQVKTFTTTGTLTPEDAGIIYIANSAAMTMNLPPAASCAGIWYRFIKTTAAAFAMTIDPFGAELVNGAATLASVATQHAQMAVYCNGTSWYATTA